MKKLEKWHFQKRGIIVSFVNETETIAINKISLCIISTVMIQIIGLKIFYQYANSVISAFTVEMKSRIASGMKNYQKRTGLLLRISKNCTNNETLSGRVVKELF